MKKPLVVILLLCCMGNVFAQQTLDTAFIKCQYQYIWQNDTLTGKTRNDILILQMGNNLSKCYSYYSYQVDSIDDLPNSDEVFWKAIGKAIDNGDFRKGNYPHKRMKTYVYKNYPKGIMTVTDSPFLQYYVYQDTLNAQNWQIKDSTKVILNDTCQMAECDFRGRHWTAWFAPGIPIGNGPWKLGGLPGLILEAYDRGKQYHFTATGISKCNEPIIIMWQPYSGNKTFEKTDRITFLKAQKEYDMNSTTYTTMATGIDLSNGEPDAKMLFDLLELDYKNKK